MKLLGAFFRLIRYPNLFFIALTQFLFYYGVILPSFENIPDTGPAISWTFLFLLILSSILIAAGGYIINDYFDLNIDRVNRPGKLVVEKFIKRRWAIVWHFGFSIAGILLSFYLGWKIRNLLLGPLNLMSVILLWFYSTTFKKQLLVGNLVISLLTSWAILVLYICEWRIHRSFTDINYSLTISRIFKFAILYGGFAFIISLIREAIKDMEDREGDAKYHCKTMPIVWGIPATKVYAAVWLIVLTASVFIILVYALQIRWWWVSVYGLIFIILPLMLIFRKLYAAILSEHFHQLSNLVKLVMLSGILSMLLLKWYS